MKKNKYIIVFFLIFSVLVFIWSISDSDYSENKEVKEIVKKDDKKIDKNVSDSRVFVDIKGEVNAPGVYELTVDNNVNDAILAAGGLTSNSDTSNINLSKKLVDEMVIIVYSYDEIKMMKEESKIVCPKVNCACVTKEDEKAVLDSGNSESDNGLININTASRDDLLSLKGVGESKADSIVKYREKNGNFETIDDIKNVSGIGDSLFEKIKDFITV